MQVRLAYKGVHLSNNFAGFLVWEYNMRKVLAGVGYTFSGDNLYAYEADILTFIGSEFNGLEHNEIKKSQRKAKSKGRRR